MIPVLRLIAIYAMVVVCGCVVYVALFQLPLAGIVFYRGLLLAAGAALIVLATLVAARRWIPISIETMIGASAVSLAFNLCLLIVFVVTIDRSISVFLLSRLDARPMSADALRDRFVSEYVGSMNQIARRVEEQQASGNITIDQNHTIHLTSQGHRFLDEARMGTRLFRTDPRFTAPPPRPDRAP